MGLCVVVDEGGGTVCSIVDEGGGSVCIVDGGGALCSSG